jgi:membrane protein implicated in regulation of membrane protease activity
MTLRLEKLLTTLFTIMCAVCAAVTIAVGWSTYTGILAYAACLLAVLAGISGFTWWHGWRIERRDRADAERVYVGMERDIADIKALLDARRSPMTEPEEGR